MDFNKRLTSLRMKKGLKQSELAKVLNVSKSTISAYENNKTMPSIEIVILIANYFEVFLDYLLCRTDYPKTIVTDNLQTLSLIKSNDKIGFIESIIELMTEYEISKKFWVRCQFKIDFDIT